MELRGADARFKQKDTLEAHDRNLAGLAKVLVRVTPSPELKLFADFIFAEEIFRVWQEATLVNYKEFLPKVEFSGLDNFRALVRYGSRALPGGDTATREFYEQNKPPERFLSKEEMALYEAAVLAGTAPPARGGDIPLSASTTLEKKAIAEREWKKFAVELAQVRAERPDNSIAAGGTLAVLGAMIVLVSVVALQRARHLPEGAPRVYPLIALGAMIGMALLVFGVAYLRKSDP